MKTGLMIVALCGTVAPALGDTLDQSQTQSGGSSTLFCCGSDIVTHQQQVTCGIAGELSRIRFLVQGNKIGQATFFVNRGPGPQTDPHDYEVTLDMATLGLGFGQVWMELDVSSANFGLAVGEQFVIGATGSTTIQAELVAGPLVSPNGPYLGGSQWSRRNGFNGGLFYQPFTGQFDLAFETYMDEPGGCKPDLTTSAIPGSPGYGTPNGIVNNDDFFYYLSQFAAGNLAVADMTTTAIPGSAGYGVPNGIINNDDFFYYLSVFAVGC